MTAQQRCRFLSHHRGMKELNYLLEGFTEKSGPNIWADPFYQELMTYDDIVLWEALMLPHATSLPEHLRSLIANIRSIHSKAQE